MDTGKQVFVWIGRETTADEKKNAMSYAHVCQLLCYLYTDVNNLCQQNYLKDTDHPLVPVTCIKSGSSSDDAFNKAF